MIVNNCHLDASVFSILFSSFFCFCCCVVDSLLGFWVFLELGSLSLIPALLYNVNLNFNFYSCILCYIIMSGLSSAVLVSGLLIPGLYNFIFFGLVIKFGLFPFMFWVYRVFGLGNWVFIFILSVIMKFPILFFCYLYGVHNIYLIYLDCFITILICCFLIWFFSLSWEYIWCHISLSSVATLMVSCFCSSIEICFFIYWYYFFWACCCIIYFINVIDKSEVKGWSFWLFCILLLVTPISVPLFYKLSVSIGILYSSVYILIAWSFYSFSEQFFLYKLASDYFYVNTFNNWV
uniref:NADH dehydrogenase subunit 2 n=1 Tax=Taenia pisiformis TaxID=85432 RepID=D3YLS9_TAEPI|nr:NADH dehydrogenase subunit 2 [Taenia pisiformis]ADC52490.1 NADH dehydrogenase subunit 2 [Taenia pisiformis]